MAWVAHISGRPVGIARYIRYPDELERAELAVEVVDAEHGRGVGRVLTEATVTAAVQGVRRLSATLDPGNAASRALLAGLGAQFHLVEGVLEATGELRLPESIASRQSRHAT